MKIPNEQRQHRRKRTLSSSRRVFWAWLGTTCFLVLLNIHPIRLLLFVSHQTTISTTHQDVVPRDEELVAAPPPKFDQHGDPAAAPAPALSILDGMLHNKLFPVLHVRDEEDIPPGRSTWGEIRRIHWKQKPTTNQGQQSQGNHPQWMTDIQQLAYIAILENGMTTMGMAFDRLSDKLGGLNATPWIPKRQIDKYLQRELLPAWKTTRNNDNQNNHTGVLLFTILRDPVDRFLSGTCQDFYMNNRHPCTRTSPSLQATMKCLMNHLQEGRFSHHQQSQHAILYSTIGSYKDLAVTVLPFGIQNQLLQEMGIYDDPNDHNPPKRIAERNRQSYTRKNPRVVEFCQTKSHQLDPKYLNIICQVYQKDVEMVRRTGQRVELCQGRLM